MEDAGCIEVTEVDAGGTISPESVDLLIMVDNSNSMSEEQASLAVALPNLVRALASGDVDLDGDQDFAPVGSLHLGVVTSDMGTGGFVVPTCDDSRFGDDGVLRRSGSGDCAAGLSPFLRFSPTGTVPIDEFAGDAACLTTAGTGGCGFEQQLESVLKAVTPSSSGVAFAEGTTGHGTSANAGFLREDSILVILVVTDENDCSAWDPELFNPTSSVYSSDLNLRCSSFPGAMHPVERYVDGLLALRPRLTDRLVFATIAGIPLDLSRADDETILADPRLVERIDPDMPTRLRPSCNVPGRGFAFPPRRLIEVARGVRARGGRALNQSICQEDFSPAVQLILAEVGRAARPICARR